MANLRGLVSRVKESGATPVPFPYPLEREGYMANHRRILAPPRPKLDVLYLDTQAKMEEESRKAESCTSPVTAVMPTQRATP